MGKQRYLTYRVSRRNRQEWFEKAPTDAQNPVRSHGILPVDIFIVNNLWLGEISIDVFSTSHFV